MIPVSEYSLLAAFDATRTVACVTDRNWRDDVTVAEAEALRWQHAMQTDDPTSEFKLNNDFRALYARRLMEREPELAEFFETRTLRSEQ